MIVLAIESTCDETGAAVARLVDGRVEILAEVKASSAEIHAKYGGIIPEIAAREQVASIIPVIETAMKTIADSHQLTADNVDALAVAVGPGLIGSLLIGVETAKALALAWKKPLIAVNHMAAHVFANYIVGEKNQDNGVPELPAVALIVSGGHTDLMYMESLDNWKWIGGTRDDAVGEAFDKAARMLGFPSPNGALVAKAAQMAVQNLESGSRKLEMIRLPRPMINDGSLEMSFSGLKTALINIVGSPSFAKATEGSSREQIISALAREFNEAVVDVLVKKTMMAAERYKPKSVLLAGGVAANQLLRQNLEARSQKSGVKFFCPDLKYCTDNAAMIAACGLMRPTYIDPLELRAEPGLEIK